MTHRNRPIALFITLFFVTQMLASCGGGGGGGDAPPASTKPPVSNVAYFSADAGDTVVSLSWTNPTSNFAGVMVRRGPTCPANPSSGTLVSSTAGTTAVDSGLTNNSTYCYVAFAFDASGTYAVGTNAFATPVAPIANSLSYVAYSAGGVHSVAVKSDGSLWAWGDNLYGQIGDGCIFAQTCYNRNTPERVGTGTTWRTVSAGIDFNIALKLDGTLWGWGANQAGEIGIGCTDSCFYISTPTQITADTNWASISAGGSFVVAIKADGTLWTWGYNRYGELGDGCTPAGGLAPATCALKATPTQVGTSTEWAAAAAGGNHALALKKDGSLWAWGNNDNGQLGLDGYNTIPTRVGTGADWKTVGAGDMHSMAIKADGTLWTWGQDDRGQLGHGCPLTSICYSKTAPTQVGAAANWKAVDGGSRRTIALKTDGTVWTWGGSSTPTGTDSSVPLQVGSATAWISVSAGGGGGYTGVGGGHFMALEVVAPGTFLLKAWGPNQSGTLGIGTGYPEWTPTLVR